MQQLCYESYLYITFKSYNLSVFIERRKIDNFDN